MRKVIYTLSTSLRDIEIYLTNLQKNKLNLSGSHLCERILSIVLKEKEMLVIFNAPPGMGVMLDI